jgi:hypothetical protein
MLDLFKNEFRRYQMPALILMTVHLAIWGFVYTQKPILQNLFIQSAALNLFMIFGGLSFGVLQMILHRRKNNWAFLMHRPVSPQNIHKSLVGAAAALILIAVVLPFAVALVSLDLFTHDPVELRHYLYLLHMIGLSFSCYLIGTYVVLSPNKGAILTIGLVSLMVNASHSTPWLTLETDFVITVIFFLLSRLSFKVNLGSHLKQKRNIFVAALVLQPALGYLVVMLQMPLYHLPMMLLDMHPDQYTVEQHKGYYSALWRMETHKRVDMILENSDYPNRKRLVEQVEFATVDELDGRLSLEPMRGELFYKDKSYALNDVPNNKQWIFSHSKMVFEGRDANSGALVGYLAETGFHGADATLTESDRFSVIPRLWRDQFVRTDNILYRVDFDEQLMEVKHQLPEGESYQSNVRFRQEAGVVVMLSEKALYFFDPGQFTEDNAYSEPTHRVVHPAALGSDTTIFYSVLVDGYLLEYRGSHVYGFEKPGVKLVYAKHDGSNQLVGEISFIDYQPVPRWVSSSDFWSSPVINGYVFSYIQGLYKPDDGRYVTLNNVADRVYATEIYWIWLFLALFSAAATYFIASKMPMDKSTRMFWVLLNLVFALPGLLTFLLMNQWRDYLFYSYDNPKVATAT